MREIAFTSFSKVTIITNVIDAAMMPVVLSLNKAEALKRYKYFLNSELSLTKIPPISKQIINPEVLEALACLKIA